jgi:hypothetical protein
MNHPQPHWRRPAAIALLLASLLPTTAPAAPGAHGPGGEHLDQKPTASAGASRPRLEAKSELFELVARLESGQLVVFVDRFDTNEPVLGAKLEVETGPHKAAAAFRAESGDYAVSDAALLGALAAPGEHALVFTLSAGADADLLDGTLSVAQPSTAAAHGTAHEHATEWTVWIGAGMLALVLVGVVVAWRRLRDKRNTRNTRTTAQGVQA